MSYTITIKKTETVTKQVGKEWTIIGQEVKVPEDISLRLDAHIDKLVIEPCDIRGYTPLVEKNFDVTTEVLTQTVDDLDLTAVICAINRILPVPPVFNLTPGQIVEVKK